MLVLSIDSSSNAATCAIVDETSVLAEIALTNKKEHSVLLMDLIDGLLKQCNLTIKDIDGFATSKGPGSFTGLRIGMATIKGLSFGSNKPCVSISTLQGLAFNVSHFNGLICPIIDALRNNVYCGIFKFTNGNLVSLTEEACLSLEEVINKVNELNEDVIFLGDGTLKHKNVLSEKVPKANFAVNNLNYTRASSIGSLGLELLQAGVHDDLNISAPVYLRKSQAEREYDKRMGLD
ncbi:tRNA threonylcarbamoyl adenosine modification protein YeaZ [Clostridium cavendishii DSM 21758]|uniref:tRNA threonylcarbamoyl adenosine modification protein YeaZ n=1 Tax=Clostridium cavendishii DSM 21758 TaxID=1121302 RepID=A0A1M6UEM6_9CLOT|nr:tRNA (adenosine(37)-N6)-threonylcarbamoyltransferase complex dimerization subunit type 1 TsaB [Clostridium cavendishii]SHK67636.1 tRNA threonylcarbamoyl adenosine modification protein YeaZ [Clostridium cavendishii DSM 21758]